MALREELRVAREEVLEHQARAALNAEDAWHEAAGLRQEVNLVKSAGRVLQEESAQCAPGVIHDWVHYAEREQELRWEVQNELDLRSAEMASMEAQVHRFAEESAWLADQAARGVAQNESAAEMALEAERAVLAGRLRTICEEAEARDAERGEAVARLRGELLREQNAARALADKAWVAERAAADARALATRPVQAPGPCCATPLLPSGPGVGLPPRAETAGSQAQEALEKALAEEKRARADDR